MAIPGDSSKDIQPTAFRWAEPRQKEIYDGLLLIGEGPAAFYKNACQIMADPAKFESATHIVGHLVREIESALRASLRTFAQDATNIASRKDSEKHAAEIKSLWQGLELPEDHPALEKWLRLADSSYKFKLPAVAHREALGSPRPITDEFERWWSDIQTILLAVLGRLRERFLEPLRGIDRLLSIADPTEDDVKFLRNNVPNNMVVLGYFFANCQNPKWLRLCRGAGYLRNPPQEGLWRVAGYLYRMAKIDGAAQEVCEIILDLPEIENRLVRAELVEAIQAMPPNLAARHTDQVCAWAADSTGFLHVELGALMRDLAKGDQRDVAFRLAKVLLKVLPPAESGQSDLSIIHPMPQIRMDISNYEQILKNHVPQLVETTGLEGLAFLCDLLSAAISFSLREPEKSVPYDLCHILHPAIDGSRQNFGPELRSLLISAIRDAAITLVTSGRVQLAVMVKALEERQPPWHIFRRIAMHLLLQIDDAATLDIAVTYLTDRDLFDSPECLHEYVLLLQRRFPSLPAEHQQRILGWIDTGLLPEQLTNLKKNLPQFGGKELTERDIARYVKLWRRDWLQRFGDSLPVDRNPQLQALIDEFGSSKHPDFSSYHEEMIGLRSPLRIEDLRAKSIDELIEYLQKWQPAEDFMGASRGGLGEKVAALVAEQPAFYAMEAYRFKGLDPTYERSLLDGLRLALGKTLEFDWRPVLGFCLWTLEQPIEIPGRKRQAIEDDPDRSWARNAVAVLVNAALEHKPVPIPFELRVELWKVLEALSKDPNPTPEHEKKYGGSNADPSHAAINSTRGQGMEAVIAYALWVRNHICGDGKSESRTPSSFDFRQIPEVRAVLEARLNPKVERSLAIRSQYGRFFSTLWYIDRAWTADRINLIFPSDETERDRWEAAWSSFLAFSNVDREIFDVLKEKYSLAIDRLGDKPALARLPIDMGQRLADHLMGFYWHGIVSAEEKHGLFDRFWLGASVKVRRYALWNLGRWIYNGTEPLDVALSKRLMSLWERRLSIAQASGNRDAYHGEIGQFGWWFCSEKFPEGWAIRQLQGAIDFAGHAEPDHLIYEKLAALCVRLPGESVSSLAKLLATASPWQISAHEKDVRKVLEAAVGSGGSARDEAVKLVHALGARGILNFRDLANNIPGKQ
ncbi:hypothetical protein [Candidatus Binatus soli]|uniref:hypothetical protein n=1 Tax=Candidatus Binatus soli TaxID=1953413 RepID=UPI003D118840